MVTGGGQEDLLATHLSSAQTKTNDRVHALKRSDTAKPVKKQPHQDLGPRRPDSFFYLIIH